MHLGGITAIPLVALDRAGEPPARVGRGFKQGLAEILTGAPESDPFEALAVVARCDAANMAVADDARAQEADRSRCNVRLRPSRSVRAGCIERVAQRGRDPAGSEQSI